MMDVIFLREVTCLKLKLGFGRARNDHRQGGFCKIYFFEKD